MGGSAGRRNAQHAAHLMMKVRVRVRKSRVEVGRAIVASEGALEVDCKWK